MAKYNATQLFKFIEGRYAGDGYLTLSEVRNTTGYGKKERYADAIVCSLWPSQGLGLIGFEIKISKSDLRHEIADPAKAEEIRQYCREWYLVVSDEKILAGVPVPEEWGIMVPKNRVLQRIRNSSVNKTPKPVSGGFLMSLLRNASKASPVIRSLMKQRDQTHDRAFHSGVEFERKRRQRFSESSESILESLENLLKENGAPSLIENYSDGQLNGHEIRENIKSLATAYRIMKEVDGDLKEYVVNSIGRAASSLADAHKRLKRLV